MSRNEKQEQRDSIIRIEKRLKFQTALIMVILALQAATVITFIKLMGP